MLWESVFGAVDPVGLAARLKKPKGPVDVILDTDAYNEIDDQYALAYLVRSEPDCWVRAVTAAPFYSDPDSGRVYRSASPGDGMERSYQEILKVLKLMDREDLIPHVFRGSERYLPGPLMPVESEAAQKIVEISKEYGPDRQLYVVAIGAITNVASALLLDPTLRERIVVVWLGGHAHHYGPWTDFNMDQDADAARVVFGCGVPLVQLPCLGVVSEFRFSRVELEYLFRGKNALCDYLIDNTFSYAEKKFGYDFWTKPLWDVTAVAWLLPGAFMEDRLMPSPVPHKGQTCSPNPDGHPMRYVYYIHKDQLARDMADKLGSPGYTRETR
jgi:pyrimidine-specific ribonucleoside hydrolase